MLRGTVRLRDGSGYLRGLCSELHKISRKSGVWRIRRLAVGHDDSWSMETYPTLLAAERAVDERNHARRKVANLCLTCVTIPQPARPGYDTCGGCAYTIDMPEADS
jgi:hypothetical protein